MENRKRKAPEKCEEDKEFEREERLLKMQLAREVYGFVNFDSVAHEKFRVHLNEEVAGILQYHLEARTSKKQWKGSIGTEVKVINGIPKESVFKALKVLWFYHFGTKLLYVTHKNVSDCTGNRVG